MWTDGTVASSRRGLGIAQFYSNTEDASDRVWEVKMSSGTCSNSYGAELCGVAAGLSEILSRQRTPGRNLAIYTDCKSLVTGLANGPLQQSSIREAHIWKMLYRIIGEGYVNRVVLQWVPGHCGLTRNESADKNAKRHAELIKRSDPLYHERVPSSYKSITSYYKEKLVHNWKETVPEITHRGVIAGKQYTNIKTKDLKRDDEVILAQLRTGYCKLLGAGLSLTETGEFTQHQCRWCNRREENVPHLFDGHCTDQRIQEHRATYVARNNTHINSTHLHTHPTQALEYFRGILATL
jgi:ribonuclease HI